VFLPLITSPACYLEWGHELAYRKSLLSDHTHKHHTRTEHEAKQKMKPWVHEETFCLYQEDYRWSCIDHGQGQKTKVKMAELD
jgi:hypothetical protein